ncbi:unnamed protein product [Pocillopora meandrina]|uniref:Homeobox domain-containing protein n=1 Tax=Pocillopora meandrina TaxID=46732 RepID=A0AAU9VNZ5_9CNID|nr:unnamed protein product [Pocillopora meandrina]
MTADRPKHGKKRPSAACRRLDFGETESSVLLSTPDLLPNKDISYRSSVIQKSFRVKRTCLTFGQQTALEDVFQRNKFLNDNEKTTIAIELGVTKTEMEVIYVGFFLS